MYDKNIVKSELNIELTDSCNLKCSYCNKHSWTTYIDTELFRNTIEKLTNVYIEKFSYICLWWGEPLVHPKFSEDNQYLNCLF